MNEVSNIIALDVGEARVGIAAANTIARLPSPLTILSNDEKIFANIQDIVQENNAETIVVGLPRNMSGEETDQSKSVREFAKKLAEHTAVQIIFTDESLSTKRAEEYKLSRKQPADKYIDDIAACFILEEYLGSKNA